MKRLILSVAGFGAVIGMGFYMHRPATPPVSTAEIAVESDPEQPSEQRQSVDAVAVKQLQQNPEPILARPLANAIARESGRVEPALLTSTDLGLVLAQAVETLVSSQTGFDQKQAAWKWLKETGRLEQAIAQLEQRTASDPLNAENLVALGVAYLKRAGLIENAREKAILAMKADQTLEAALSLDPSNWEARYTKAVGMSYWPAELKKGQEVIEQVQILIQQQETQPAQPQFARSYLWLGDQYQKAAQAVYAAQVWQRGATFFPENEELKRRLSSTPSQP